MPRSPWVFAPCSFCSHSLIFHSAQCSATQLPLYSMPSWCGAIWKHHSYGGCFFINSSTCNSFTSLVKAKHSHFHFNRWHRSKDCVLCFVKNKHTNKSSIPCSQGWLTTHCTAKKDQEILIVFPPSPECWDYRYTPLCSVYLMLNKYLMLGFVQAGPVLNHLS